MQLELKIDVPEDAAAALQRLEVTPLEYASEVLRAHFETLALGEEGKIENRADWQDAILTGRSEIAEGRGVPDEEVEAWHKSHVE
jgi:predicted transcriptional regulator